MNTKHTYFGEVISLFIFLLSMSLQNLNAQNDAESKDELISKEIILDSKIESISIDVADHVEFFKSDIFKIELISSSMLPVTTIDDKNARFMIKRNSNDSMPNLIVKIYSPNINLSVMYGIIGKMTSPEEVSFKSLKISGQTAGDFDLRVNCKKMSFYGQIVGNVVLKGVADELVVDIRIMGEWDSRQLISKEANVKIDIGKKIGVNVEDNLILAVKKRKKIEIELIGKPKIKYNGNKRSINKQ